LAPRKVPFVSISYASVVLSQKHICKYQLAPLRRGFFAPGLNSRRSDGTSSSPFPLVHRRTSQREETHMNNIIWLVGAVVILLAILSFFGFR
jgi:hypothetical protein